MASQAVCKAQGVVVGALRTSVLARPAPRAGVRAPMYSTKTQVFAPRPMGVRSRKMATVTKASANGAGLNIDLRGEWWAVSHHAIHAELG